ncbi:MAG: hypothetical protein COA32_16330 [Fluviicola sp.]|nr:MAG: hypothetical protein COA32_16330 [Fluviicola sp.]
MKKKTKILMLSAGALIMSGVLMAAASETLNSSKKVDENEPKKKYEVINFRDGEVITIDTLLPMNSNYTVEQFLSDRNIVPENLNIMHIPYGDEPTQRQEEHKMVMKTLSHSDETSFEEGEQVVEIKVEVDDQGNLIATKTINGEEVELTPEELEGIQTMHEAHEGGEGNHEVMIDIDNLDSLEGEVHKIIELELSDLDIDIDSLMNSMTSEIDIDTTGKKIFVRSQITTGDLGEGEQVIVIHESDKMEWNSEDGEKQIEVISSENDGDVTIVIVTENIPAQKNMRKTDMSIYPNPSTGKFKLKFDQKNKTSTKIQITDLSGKQVYSEDLGEFKGEYNKQIDLSQFGKGVYMIYINDSESSAKGKVIIK